MTSYTEIRVLNKNEENVKVSIVTLTCLLSPFVKVFVAQLLKISLSLGTKFNLATFATNLCGETVHFHSRRDGNMLEAEGGGVGKQGLLLRHHHHHLFLRKLWLLPDY